MIYSRYTRELRTNNGKLLKKLDCPLHKEWSQLTVIQGDETRRRCGSCEKSVVNLEGKSEEEVESLFLQSPTCCVYLPPDATNIQVEGSRYRESRDPCSCRRIQTARGMEAIKQAVKDGFWPLVKKVERSSKFSKWIEVYQNEETGAIHIIDDPRMIIKPSWKRIIDRFSFNPYSCTEHLAAYLIPLDLKVGEYVFLVDLIEHLVSVRRIDDTPHERLESAFAIWDGKEFQIQWDEQKDALIYIIG